MNINCTKINNLVNTPMNTVMCVDQNKKAYIVLKKLLLILPNKHVIQDEFSLVCFHFIACSSSYISLIFFSSFSCLRANSSGLLAGFSLSIHLNESISLFLIRVEKHII